jgi:hypothetical protein
MELEYLVERTTLVEEILEDISVSSDTYLKLVPFLPFSIGVGLPWRGSCLQRIERYSYSLFLVFLC